MEIRNIIKDANNGVSNGNDILDFYAKTETNREMAEAACTKLIGAPVDWFTKFESKLIDGYVSSFEALLYINYLREFKQSYLDKGEYSPTLNALLPEDEFLKDATNLFFNIDGYSVTEDGLYLVEKGTTEQIKEENGDTLIIVFYLHSSTFESQELIQSYSDGVTAGMEKVGIKGMYFFLPTEGEDRIDCINPRLVTEKEFADTRIKLELIKKMFDIYPS
jgi:hypothetical protein